MNNIELDLSQVDSIYDNSQKCQIKFYPIAHQKLKHFCFGLSHLDRQIYRENLNDDSFWQDFLLTFKRYRFELCSTPIPFNSPEIIDKINLEHLQKQLKRIKLIYSEEIYHLTQEVFDQFYALIQSSDNPLLDYVDQHLSLSSHKRLYLPVLLRRSKQVNLVKKYLSSKLELLTPSKLRDCQCYDQLIVIGCTRWFPEYIFTAPRAREIDIIHYDWFKDKWKSQPVFVCSSNIEQENDLVPDNSRKKPEPEKLPSNQLAPEEVLPPKIDLNQLAKQYSSSSERSDEIEAYLFSLDGDNAVFLDKDSKAFIIDLAEEDESLVARKPVNEIEQDMFILLRTKGGGDYIKDTANKILHQSGEDYHTLRKLQQEWKLSLKNMIKRTNLHSVCVRLGKEGCKLAESEINIRNCLSANYIKPNNENDFKMILRVIGLGDRFDELYNAATLISKAHKKAGHHLGKLIRDNIENYDLTQLEQHGIMEFTLDEEDSGSLTAFRVLDISKDTIFVPFYQHSKPFEI
jgi:hypothetical protein